MNKRLLLIFLSLLCVQGIFSACLPGWKYNRSITVTNSNASAYSAFQVKVTVNTQALIAAGKMQANGNDIRFTDGNCNNLQYWIDSNLNTTTTVIWVKVGSIPSSGSATIYMYYGNSCATAGQNGDSTFLLFDDFLGSSLNTSKWNLYQNTPISCAFSVGGGQVYFATSLVGDNMLRSVNAFASPIRLETKVTGNANDYPNIALLNSGTFTGVSLLTGTGAYSNVFHTSTTVAAGASYSSATNSSGVARANGVWGLTWPATNSATSTFPGGTQTLGATSAIAGSQHAALGLLYQGVGTVQFDWARVRKYAPIEMGTTVNAENKQSVQVTFSPANICPGAQFTVIVSKSGVYFNSGNVFKVELSDASGSFGSPILLGTVNDTIPDTVIAEFPKNTPPGTGYKVRVTTSNPAFTCFVADASLTVYPKPTPAFSVLNDNQCYKNNKYNFSSSSSISSGSIVTHIWNWGDASKIDTLGAITTASHKFSPFYTYYYPKLTVVSNLGCSDSISQRVNIRETPDVKTEFNDTIQCYKGNKYIIKSTTKLLSGTLTLVSWDLGDGSPAKNGIDSFAYKFGSAGTYTVRQINQHSNGCRDTGYLSALVNTHPKAKISTNDTDQCLTGNKFIYQSASTITNGLPLINYWNIGDGITKDMQDTVHWTYPNANNRTVRLITVSDDGTDGCSDTAYQKILVNPMPKALVTSYDPEKCFNYNKFRFKGKSTIASGTITHNWNFGDNTTSNNKDSITHSYATQGTYTVKLYAVSNKGCIDSITTSVIVRPSPIPLFTIDKDIQCLKYNLFKTLSQSTIASGTFSRIWQVSDGMTYTDVDSIAHSFSAQGNYEIMLIVKSTYNCADSISDSVSVLPIPTSSFTIDKTDQCLLGNKFNFTDNSTVGSGTLTGNKWLFDDGATASNQPKPSHSYSIENGYNVGLIVYASNGCFDTSFQPVKVYPHPGSDFFINDTGQCVNNNAFVFNNNTFITEGSFTNRWFYGDGSAFEDKLNGSHKYTKDSTFIVKIISFSDQGCSDTTWKTVTVFPKAKTNFTIDNTDQCKLGNNFNFASTTTLKKGTYTLSWNFGDGTNIGNTPTAQHSYSSVQQYNVRLISQTDESCLDTIIKTVRTLPMPVASFNPTFDKSCLKNNNFEFNATSTGALSISHNWYFGDNDSAINTNYVLHSYQNYGTFTVTVIAIAKNGSCKDTTSKVMTVFPMPVASFTIDNNQQCFKGNNFNFSSTSTIPTGTIDVTNWNFGDKTSSTSPTPNKSYLKVDSFRVSLVVTSNNNCIDSTAAKVYVFPMPTADFTINPKSSCLKKNSFAISNKSKITGGVISKYQFYYGDGDSSLLQNPNPYSYKVAGDYAVSLKVTTDRGCWDTISTQVSVNPNPSLAFQVDPVCLKDSSHFINKSTLGGSGSITAWKWVFGDGKISTLQSPAHKYKAVGSYNILLIGTTNKLCIDSLVIAGAAVVNPNPTARFLYQKLRSWENEVDIQYIDSSRGAISWKWDFGTMGTSTDQNPKLFYVDTLTQPTSLVVTNVFGCKDTAFEVLFIAPDVIYYMPNAFTPNDDNINETFKPKGLAYALNYKFIIFDRWGNILFKTDNPQQGWDGKYENELVQQDVYFFRLEFVGADELRHEEKGHVIVLR